MSNNHCTFFTTVDAVFLPVRYILMLEILILTRIQFKLNVRVRVARATVLYYNCGILNSNKSKRLA